MQSIQASTGSYTLVILKTNQQSTGLQYRFCSVGIPSSCCAGYVDKVWTTFVASAGTMKKLPI